MSETDNTQTGTGGNESDNESAPAAPTELSLLKERAKLMNISFSNNISVDALRKKIQDKLDAEQPAETGETDDEDEAPVAEVAGPGPVSTDELAAPVAAAQPLSRKAQVQQMRDELIAEQTRLIRVRITNLDPKKKDLPGEIVTVGNEFIGTIRKYVPFGEATDGGYHIPFCIYTQLEERKFLSITVKKGPDGREAVSHRQAKEFAIEVLPQLTQAELNQLAAAQAAAGLIEPGLEG
jgi:hypothetical protein